MTRPLRIMLMLLGSGWSQVLLVLGLALLLMPGGPEGRLAPALALLGAGAFVAMWLVIDPLVPQAGAGLVVTLKTASLLLFIGGSAVAMA